MRYWVGVAWVGSGGRGGMGVVCVVEGFGFGCFLVVCPCGRRFVGLGSLDMRVRER